MISVFAFTENNIKTICSRRPDIGRKFWPEGKLVKGQGLLQHLLQAVVPHLDQEQLRVTRTSERTKRSLISLQWTDLWTDCV